jgi:single-strand DNA-binding protein
MNDFNETVIIGRATEDIKATVYGDKIKYVFIIAVNYYSNKKQKKYSEFIPVCFWKDQPFKELDQLEKGDNVIVNGRVSIHSYEKNNQKKWVTEVIGKYVRVFKQNKETKDMADLLQLIKSNKKLLDEITASSDIMFSDDLTAELLSGDASDT